MADVSLVCVREDAWKADLLSDALQRYGFSVCRSASVFEDFQGYAAVVVLLSPGAARSELVMHTASRALDWGKLIPVFVNLCHLPDRLAGVALHDLSAWDGRSEDAVVKAIAYHAQRLSGAPGRPALGAPRSRDQGPPLQVEGPAAYLEPPRVTPNYDYDYNQGFPNQGFPAYAAEPGNHPHRGYTPPEPYYVATAHNELDHPGYARHHEPAVAAPSYGGDAASRRAYLMERAAYAERSSYEPPEPPPARQRRPSSSLFSVIFSALALLGTAWVEEARTREVQIMRATPAEATAILTTPAAIDVGPPERAVPTGKSFSGSPAPSGE